MVAEVPEEKGEGGSPAAWAAWEWECNRERGASAGTRTPSSANAATQRRGSYQYKRPRHPPSPFLFQRCTIASMTLKNRHITVYFGIAVGIVMFVIVLSAVYFLPRTEVRGCPENTVPSYHPGECRPLLPTETDTTFPWDRQQAEAQDFFRKFQQNVAKDKRKEVAEMMMYPLRINYYTDPKDADYRFVNSPAELLSVYDKVFHKSVKDYIANYEASKVWGNDYFLQTGFGEIGIYCKTLGDCPKCDFEFKVKIIHSNLIYRATIEDDFGNPLKPGDKQ
jgi:hypothetical protein